MSNHLRFQLVGIKDSQRKVFASFKDKKVAIINMATMPTGKWDIVELIDNETDKRIAAIMDINPFNAMDPSRN